MKFPYGFLNWGDSPQGAATIDDSDSDDSVCDEGLFMKFHRMVFYQYKNVLQSEYINQQPF